MRKVVTNNELPHLWAHQSQDGARNSNGSFYFVGPWIFSWGRHFPIAVRVAEDTVVMTEETVSNSTSRHQSLVREACRHLSVIKVPRLDFGDNALTLARRLLKESGDVWKTFQESPAHHFRKVVDAHDRSTLLAGNANLLSKRLRRIHQFKAITVAGVRSDDVFDEDARNRIDEISQVLGNRKNAIEHSDKLSEARARLADSQSRNSGGNGRGSVDDDSIERWRNGQRKALQLFKRVYGHDLLRYDAKDDVLTTTQGVQVNGSDVREFWPYLRRALRSGEPFVNFPDAKLGPFSGIKLEGNSLHVGCHHFQIDNIWKVAEDMGLIRQEEVA